MVTTNLNKIIDVNYYPVETARRSNMRHRPIGIGVQGLADTFILLGMAFDSPEVNHFLEAGFCLHSQLDVLQFYIFTWMWNAGSAVEQGDFCNYILSCFKNFF